MPQPFQKYALDYPAAKAAIAKCLDGSILPRLENIALRFSYALEEKTINLKKGNEEEFLKAVLAKTVNEMFGTIGSLLNGALLASYHHARSILEMSAALEHIYCEPSKRERRLEKFVEYPNVGEYLHYLDWQQRLSEGEIAKEHFMRQCAVTESTFQELGKRIPIWQNLWKLKTADPKEIQYWHYPATIKDLFKSSERIITLWDTYEALCHATHLSPIGKRIAGGHFSIGFPRINNGYDYRKINFPIEASIMGAQNITISLYETVKAGLIEGILE